MDPTNALPLEDHLPPIQRTSTWFEQRRFSKTRILSLHYYRAYVTYLLLAMFFFSIIFDLMSDSSVSFLDSVFMVVSAGSMTGLSTVDFSRVGTIAEVVIWLAILLCSPMMMTLIPPVLRKRSYYRQARFEMRMGSQGARSVIETNFHGTDFKVLTRLMWVVFGYWIVCQLLGWLLLYFFLSLEKSAKFLDLRMIWDALFLSTSAFHNAGLVTLEKGLPCDSENALVDWGVLLTVSMLILAGNSCFPLFLRCTMWALSKWRNDQDEQVTALLEEPRKFYTHLFPSKSTRYLALITFALFGVQCAVLSVADWRSLGNRRVLATIFMSVSTRTAGFSVIPLTMLSLPSTWLMTVCMWISSCPVVATMRGTAEKSDVPATTNSDVGIRSQIGYFVGDYAISQVVLFSLILFFQTSTWYDVSSLVPTMFEFSSAFGTVGLSLSDGASSYCARWGSGAKLSLMVVMIMGRLRGLPHSIDPSVTLPVSTFEDTLHHDSIRSGDHVEDTSPPHGSAYFGFFLKSAPAPAADIVTEG
eukprot:TRINITY_DN41744_c0_g1_i1.p1 TRINITY_DN41744_c0_g1~~TRINITY_DN41744_c0_g1_i1.p1  ORF type:complete len:529 (+),score=64.10 TRINITY_DN41744_c0_g1_i1:29-1615(+)